MLFGFLIFCFSLLALWFWGVAGIVLWCMLVLLVCVVGFGGDCGGVTPVSISNTVVKPSCADGTWT